MIRVFDGNNVLRRLAEQRDQLAGYIPMNLRLRYEETRPTDIWVWDGRKHNERRREIYPRYKMNRSPVAEDVYAQIRLWRKILTYSPAMQIEVEGWEADDVIGTLVRKYPHRCEVHTNDMDYVQIGHLCKLNGVKDKGVAPRWIALYKALVGDPSDNIAGIPGFGPKRWLEMEEHWEWIEQAIVSGSPHQFVDLPFKPAVKAWLLEPENVRELQAMLTITHFMNVPDDELEGGISQGTPNRHEANQLFKEYFL